MEYRRFAFRSKTIETTFTIFFREIEMKNSKIGWTDHTWNPWRGCSKVSEECLYCYIEKSIGRFNKEVEPFAGPLRASEALWKDPFKWNREAEPSQERPRVFTCSTSDFFHEQADEWRDDAWEAIRECQNLDWLILTKRANRITDCLPDDWGEGYPNVWLGVTCGVESSLNRVDELMKIPAHIRFISAEPLLESIDFSEYLATGKIHWIITGCEQAAKGKRREMDRDWVRRIDRQCRDHRVPHFFKQYYEVNDAGDEIGTPVTDGLLDGEVRQEFPLATQDQLDPAA